MDWDKMPKWLGYNYTAKIHSKPSGPTLPQNNIVTRPLVVLITGAGKGLGYHLSLAYASARASGIVISSRTQVDLDALEKEIKGINPDCQVLSVVCDTTKQDGLTSLANQIKERFGRLDIVIANAGVISSYLPDGSLPTALVDDLDFERVININLTGTAITARTMLPLLLSKDTTEPSPRAFIAVTSLASLFPRSAPTTTAYNISKIAINRLVELLSADHAKDGLVAYAIHPGAVVTPQTQKHSTEKGDMWEQALTDDVELCGGFCTWLTHPDRQKEGVAGKLSGRYLSANWDVVELGEKARGWKGSGEVGEGEGEGEGGEEELVVGGDELKMRLWV